MNTALELRSDCTGPGSEFLLGHSMTRTQNHC